MSEEDRVRWNKRFNDGAYKERTHPSALLADNLPLLQAALKKEEGGAGPQALDIASGAGRNSLYLLDLGFSVTAVDISTVALQRLKVDALPAHALSVKEHDFDSGLPDLRQQYSLIVVMRFLKLNLMEDLQALLLPGGVLMCEVLLQQPPSISGSITTSAGPAGGRFRAEHGALKSSIKGMELLHYFEGEVEDPDGKSAHVAQLIAKNVG